MNNKYTKLLICSSIAFSAAAETIKQNEEMVKIDEIEVTGVNQAAAEFVLEPSANSKFLVPISELARSIDIITNEEFTQKGAINLQETLNYTAGVFPGAFGLDTRFDSITIRGLTPQQFQDGFLSFSGFYNKARAEIYTLESVEVIKGPASALYGQGALGGIINVNSKLPKAEAAGELNFQIGSNDRYQAAVDLTGPINEDGTLLYRVVALARESETEVDFVDDDALVFMPSVTWLPTEKTSITFLAEYQENDTGSTLQFIPDLDPFPGAGAGPAFTDVLPALSTLDIDPKEFTGEPDFDKLEAEQFSFSALLDQKINDTFSFGANLRYTESESIYQYHQALGYSIAAPSTRFFFPAFPTLSEPGDVYRLGYQSDQTLEILAANAILRAEGSFLGLEHSAQLGIDYADVESEDDRPRDAVLEGLLGPAVGFFLPFTSTNLLSPQFVGAPDVPDTLELRDQSTEQTGVFFSDVIKYEKLITSFNLRMDFVDQSFVSQTPDPAEAEDNSDDFDEFSFDAALMYQFDNGLSPYYSYAESFTPNDADTMGNPVDPTDGFQHEVGLKYVPENGNTVITAAIFYIEEENRPIDETFPVAIIDATYEGFEFQIDHRFQDFYLQASYSYLKTDQEGESITGEEVPFVPDQLANAWISYAPSSGTLEGFRIGLGARYIGNTLSPSNNLETGGYTLFDVMLGYQFNKIDLQLNVTNLADKEFTAAFGDSGPLGAQSYEGPGRFASVTASYRF
ncbi:MAG: TonB-dependent siderophore receptor [Verrucomicrobiota bacterium]